MIAIWKVLLISYDTRIIREFSVTFKKEFSEDLVYILRILRYTPRSLSIFDFKHPSKSRVKATTPSNGRRTISND